MFYRCQFAETISLVHYVTLQQDEHAQAVQQANINRRREAAAKEREAKEKQQKENLQRSVCY